MNGVHDNPFLRLLEEAKVTARRIDDDGYRSLAHSAIGVLEARSGRDPRSSFEEARRAATVAAFDSERGVEASCVLAKAEANTGLDPSNTFDQAKEAARQLNLLSRLNAEKAIAEAEAAAGRFDAARETARSIASSSMAAEAFSAIAREEARAGRAQDTSLASALDRAKTVDNPWQRALAYVSVAEAETAAGKNPAVSLEIAESLECECQEEGQEANWDDVLECITEVRIAARQFLEAHSTVSRIRDDSLRRYLQRSIADASGSPANVRRASDQDSDVVETECRSTGRFRSPGIAGATSPRRDAELMRETRRHLDAARRAAVTGSREKGSFEAAIDCAMEIRNRNVKGRMLLEIVEAQLSAAELLMGRPAAPAVGNSSRQGEENVN